LGTASGGAVSHSQAVPTALLGGPVVRTILKKIKHEPAVLIGLVVAVLVAIQAALAVGTPLTPAALVPVVVGVVIRFFVTPAHEVVLAEDPK
jgi:hypothetical protein